MEQIIQNLKQKLEGKQKLLDQQRKMTNKTARQVHRIEKALEVLTKEDPLLPKKKFEVKLEKSKKIGPLSPVQQKIFNFLESQNGEWCTAKTIQIRADIKRGSVTSALNVLIKKSRVECKGRGVHYYPRVYRIIGSNISYYRK